jgi:regulator of replication initiation timing
MYLYIFLEQESLVISLVDHFSGLAHIITKKMKYKKNFVSGVSGKLDNNRSSESSFLDKCESVFMKVTQQHQTIEKLKEDNRELKKENQDLKEENHKLRQIVNKYQQPKIKKTDAQIKGTEEEVQVQELIILNSIEPFDSFVLQHIDEDLLKSDQFTFNPDKEKEIALTQQTDPIVKNISQETLNEQKTSTRVLKTEVVKSQINNNKSRKERSKTVDQPVNVTKMQETTTRTKRKLQYQSGPLKKKKKKELIF